MQPERAKRQLRSLNGLPISLDDSTDIELSFDLAVSHGLTLYDAVYLELALRTGLPLATLDRELIRVAPEADVELFSA